MSTALATPLAVLGQDVQVPLVSGGSVGYAALDYAASAPALRRVWDDIAAYVPYYGSVHRGAGYLSQLSTDLFEQSRRTVADFLSLREGDQVVFTRATTDSLNLLAGAVPAGTRVFVFETEHHASLLPWARAGLPVTYLRAPRSHGEAVATLEAALYEQPNGPRLFCVTGASNVTGELWPVAELTRVAHRHGARVVLDAAQLAPHRRVSVSELDVDWIAFSGHKLYAPFGAGVLAGRADWLDAAEPYLAGGGASRTVAGGDAAVAVEWHRGPARHEAGSPNVIGAYAIASACRALTEEGFDSLEAREQALIEKLEAGLAEIPEVKVLGLFGAGSARVGVLSFVVEGWNSSHFAAALSAEYGIGVRDGLFCAHPLVRTLLGGDASGPVSVCGAPEPAALGDRSLNAIRVSFGAGTPEEHVDRFLAAVRELITDGARWTYRNEDGRCVADTRRIG